MRSTSMCAIPAVGSSSSSIFGLERERGRDLQRPLAAVGELGCRCVGELAEADVIQQFPRAAVVAVEQGLGAPEVEAAAARALERHAHVLQRGQVAEHGRDLKAADEPEPCHRRRGEAGDVPPLEAHGAARGLEKLGEQVEAGGLAGAVRADQRVDRPRLHPQIDLVHGHEAAKLAGQSAGLQDGVGHPGCLPINIEVLICTRRRATQGHPERPGLSAKRVSAPGRRYPAPGRCRAVRRG